MFQRNRESDRWFWKMGWNMNVDFAIWILEQDGIQVPPFDKHQLGDRVLSSRGMSASDWSQWFERLVAKERKNHDWLIANQQRVLDDPMQLEHGFTIEPYTLYEGSEIIRELLAERWQIFTGIWNARSRNHDVEIQHLQDMLTKPRNHWNELKKLRTETTLWVNIILIGYPYVLIHHISPCTVIVATAGNKFDPVTSQKMLHEAITN